MNFRDRGIILSKKPLKEQSCIITIFTEKHGIYSGVMQQYNKKAGDSLAESNLVDFFWNARLHEHIGLAKAELIKSYNAPIMTNKTKLYAFNSIISLLKIAFCEREPHNNLFPSLLNFVEGFKEKFSLVQYIQLELAILAETGYELQLNHCAVSNSQTDLFYVSPKSGRAVSQQVGVEYESKLLKLPQFLVKNSIISNTDISDAFKLTSYFFARYIFPNKPQPAARLCLIEHLMQN